jgi:hypothetical protein
MEDVFEVYHLPYDTDFPVVCLDESNKQLVDHVRLRVQIARHTEVIET